MSYKRFKYFHISKMKKIRFLSIKSSSKLCVIFLHGFMSNIEGEKPLNFAKFCHRKKINFLALEYSGMENHMENLLMEIFQVGQMMHIK